MTTTANLHARHELLQTLAACQHGVLSRSQLLRVGFSPEAVRHGIKAARLHPLYAGIYVVGRRELSRRGSWMAAVLSCGDHAALSHTTAGALWKMCDEQFRYVEVSIPARLRRRRDGVRVHRRRQLLNGDITLREGIPVTSPVLTVVDLAAVLPRKRIERVIKEADKRELVSPEELRTALQKMSPRPGLKILREILDRRTFRLTDSELERRFLRLSQVAGLPAPTTGAELNGFRVDFYWPNLRLIVETDGLRYHRTAQQQSLDRYRDQTQAAAGLTTLRFTHQQVRYDAEHVTRTLTAVAQRQSVSGS